MTNYKNILGSILIAVGLFFFWIWILPSYDAISLIGPIIESKELKLVSKEAILGRLEDLSQKYDQRQEDIKRLGFIVPLDKDQPVIVSALEDISSKTGMLLLKIGLSPRDENNSNLGLEIPAGLGSILVTLELDGTYLSFTNFLDQVEKNIRLMDVTSFDVSSLSDPNSKLLSFKITIDTYYLK